MLNPSIFQFDYFRQLVTPPIKRKNDRAKNGGIPASRTIHPKKPPKLKDQGIKKYSIPRTAKAAKIRSMLLIFIFSVDR
jgi:hypothetical protein